MVSIEVLQSFDSIKRDIERIVGIYDRIEIEEDLEWNVVEEGRDASRISPVIATDSSFIGKHLRIAYIYLIQATALTYFYNGEEGLKIDWGMSVIKVESRVIENIGIPEYMGGSLAGNVGDEFRARDREIKHRRRIVHHVSKDLEVGATMDAVDRLVDRGMKPVLVLMDGSLNSFLALRFKKKDSLSMKLKRSWSRRIEMLRKIDSLAEGLVFISKSTTLQPLAYMLVESGKIKIGGEAAVVPDYIVVEKILKKRYGEAWRVPGFLDPIYPPRNKDTGDEMTITYAIFSRGGPVYQLSLLGRHDRKSLEKIVSMINAISPSGYPEPLRHAHATSKLSHSVLDQLLSTHNMLFESGREVLEEWI